MTQTDSFPTNNTRDFLKTFGRLNRRHSQVYLAIGGHQNSISICSGFNCFALSLHFSSQIKHYILCDGCLAFNFTDKGIGCTGSNSGWNSIFSFRTVSPRQRTHAHLTLGAGNLFALQNMFTWESSDNLAQIFVKEQQSYLIWWQPSLFSRWRLLI